ncbi:MAG: hypothetical protein GDA41_02545 [Rhodospirillales bacterium]|nr:hypothetical protein [Rhodospirillales bacterium]
MAGDAAKFAAPIKGGYAEGNAGAAPGGGTWLPGTIPAGYGFFWYSFF